MILTLHHQHLPALAQLSRGLKEYYQNDVDHATLIKDIRDLLTAGQVIGALHGNRLIGYLSYKLFGHRHRNFPHSIFLNELFVLPRYRQRGYGSQLIRHLLKLHFPSIYQMYSVTHVPSQPLLTKFYEQFGFEFNRILPSGNYVLVKWRTPPADHVAIMKPAWGLLPKILTGEKTVESRWYQTKRDPWNKVKTGDTVYFKNSGEAVTVKATVARVFQYEALTPAVTQAIWQAYGKAIGLPTPSDWPTYAKKRYCILVFLRDPQLIPPFAINKAGFGSAAAWLCVKDINNVIIA